MKIFTFGAGGESEQQWLARKIRKHSVGSPYADAVVVGPGYASMKMIAEAAAPTYDESRQSARQSIEWVLKLVRERPQEVQEAFLVDARKNAIEYKFPDYVRQIDAVMPRFVGKKMPEPHLSTGGKIGFALASLIGLVVFGKAIKEQMR